MSETVTINLATAGLDEITEACRKLAAHYVMAERADVLAFLRKRRAAAETVAKRYPEDAERGRIIAQQIGAEIEMIEQGLHVGDAACEAALMPSAAAESARPD